MNRNELIHKIKEAGKTALVACLISGALIAGEKEAIAQEPNQEYGLAKIIKNVEREYTLSSEQIVQKKEELKLPESVPEVKLTLSVPGPLHDSDANSRDIYTLNQILGKGSYFLGVNSRLDENLIGRMSIILSHIYLADVLQTTSHELAHIRVGEKYGDIKWSFRLKSSDFSYNFDKSYKDDPSLEQRLKEVVAGLNQDEFNSKFVWFKNNTENFTFDNGILYLFSKFSDTFYNLKSKKEFGNSNLNDMGDVNAYLFYLSNIKGIKVSKQEHLVQALLADILSVHTWDSIKAVNEYLTTGKRITNPTTLKVNGIEVTPPLFGYYLVIGDGKDGSFYDATSIVNPKGENPIELSVGTSTVVGTKRLKSLSIATQQNDLRLVKILGDNKRTGYFRIGGKYYNIKFGENKYALRVNPYMYMTVLHKPFSYEGISAGAEIFKPLIDKMGLVGKIDYGKNDLENIIKDKDNGFSFSFGVTFVF